MNCSRNSACSPWRSSVASVVARRVLASRWKAMSSANSLNMPITSGVSSICGFGSRAHRVPKNEAVRQEDRDRDIALEAIHDWGRMETVDFVLSRMIDNDGIAALPDFVADRRLDFKLAAGLQPERDFVFDATHNPAVFGHSRHGCKAHARRATYYVKDGRDRWNPRDRFDISVAAVHCLSPPTALQRAVIYG